MKELKLNRSIEFSERPPFPQNMLLELTNTCNHRCVMCAYRKFTPAPVIMRKETAFNILEQAYKIGVREVGFYMISEPFLSKILEDCTLYAKNLGYTYIYLTTNGSLANPDRVKKLFAGGLNSIKFSVNAGRPDTYKRVHGKGDFEKVINNIHMADKARREMNIDVGIFVSFVENIINKGEIDILKDALRSGGGGGIVTVALIIFILLPQEMVAV